MTTKSELHAVELPAVFEGIDELSAAFIAVPCGLMAFLLFFGGLPGLGAVLMGLGSVLALGNRYRCEVDSTGITLTRRLGFVMPIRRRQFLLDAEPALYEAFDSPRPEGVFLRTGSFLDESKPFGPYFSVEAQEALRVAIQVAVERARSLCPAPPAQLRFPPLDDQANSVQVIERGADGRPTGATALEPLRLRGIEIPAGSSLHFNKRNPLVSWTDPRREDALWAVDCAAKTALPSGLTVEPGARLYIPRQRDGIGVDNGLAGPVRIDGRWVDGSQPLRFDADGKLVRYTLAEPVTVGRLGILPPGCEVIRSQLGANAETVRVEVSRPTFFDGRTYRAGQHIHLRAPWHVHCWHPRFGLEKFVRDPVWDLIESV